MVTLNKSVSIIIDNLAPRKLHCCEFDRNFISLASPKTFISD